MRGLDETLSLYVTLHEAARCIGKCVSVTLDVCGIEDAVQGDGTI